MRPCPFCGAALRPIAGPSSKVTSYGHPSAKEGSSCLLAGWAIGADRIGHWDLRAAAPVVHMEVVGDAPTFNDEGRGQAIGVKMLNDIIDYYRSFANAQIKRGT